MPHPAELQPNVVAQIHVKAGLDERLIDTRCIGVETARMLDLAIEVVTERLTAQLCGTADFCRHDALVPATARIGNRTYALFDIRPRLLNSSRFGVEVQIATNLGRTVNRGSWPAHNIHPVRGTNRRWVVAWVVQTTYPAEIGLARRATNVQ